MRFADFALKSPHFGVKLNLVGRSLWGREIASSNLATPTNFYILVD